MGSAEPACAVCVVYALPREQWLIRLQLRAGSVVADAISASGLLRECPELCTPDQLPPTLDLTRYRLGSFGRWRAIDEVLTDGERIEILRPLQADPKDARRHKAQVSQAGKRRQRSRNPAEHGG